MSILKHFQTLKVVPPSAATSLAVSSATKCRDLIGCFKCHQVPRPHWLFQVPPSATTSLAVSGPKCRASLAVSPQGRASAVRPPPRPHGCFKCHQVPRPHWLFQVPPSAATSLAVSSDDISSTDIHVDLTRDEQPCASGLAQADINDLDHDNQFCNPPAAKSQIAVVRKDLVRFFECDQGISGQELASKITSCLQKYRLDLSNAVRGQAYKHGRFSECLVLDVAKVVLDVAKVVLDVEKVMLDVAKVVLDVGKVVLDVAKVVLDVAKVVLDVAKVVLDVAKVVLDVGNVVLDVAKVVLDVAKVVLDMVKVVLDVAKVVLDVAKVVLDVAKVVLDVAKVVLDVAKVVLDVAKVVLDVGKVVLDVGKVVLDVGKVVLDVAKVVLDVAKVVLDVAKVVLDVGKVVLDVGKVVLDGVQHCHHLRHLPITTAF
ncbi:hypothetical protein EMCRGX_G010311 [Ephydatia muelleri]